MGSAINIKRLVHEVSTGTLASVFPDSGNNAGGTFMNYIRITADMFKVDLSLSWRFAVNSMAMIQAHDDSPVPCSLLRTPFSRNAPLPYIVIYQKHPINTLARRFIYRSNADGRHLLAHESRQSRLHWRESPNPLQSAGTARRRKLEADVEPRTSPTSPSMISLNPN